MKFKFYFIICLGFVELNTALKCYQCSVSDPGTGKCIAETSEVIECKSGQVCTYGRAILSDDQVSNNCEDRKACKADETCKFCENDLCNGALPVLPSNSGNNLSLDGKNLNSTLIKMPTGQNSTEQQKVDVQKPKRPSFNLRELIMNKSNLYQDHNGDIVVGTPKRPRPLDLVQLIGDTISSTSGQTLQSHIQKISKKKKFDPKNNTNETVQKPVLPSKNVTVNLPEVDGDKMKYNNTDADVTIGTTESSKVETKIEILKSDKVEDNSEAVTISTNEKINQTEQPESLNKQVEAVEKLDLTKLEWKPIEVLKKESTKSQTAKKIPEIVKKTLDKEETSVTTKELPLIEPETINAEIENESVETSDIAPLNRGEATKNISLQEPKKSIENNSSSIIPLETKDEPEPINSESETTVEEEKIKNDQDETKESSAKKADKKEEKIKPAKQKVKNIKDEPKAKAEKSHEIKEELLEQKSEVQPTEVEEAVTELDDEAVTESDNSITTQKTELEDQPESESPDDEENEENDEQQGSLKAQKEQNDLKEDPKIVQANSLNSTQSKSKPKTEKEKIKAQKKTTNNLDDEMKQNHLASSYILNKSTNDLDIVEAPDANDETTATRKDDEYSDDEYYEDLEAQESEIIEEMAPVNFEKAEIMNLEEKNPEDNLQSKRDCNNIEEPVMEPSDCSEPDVCSDHKYPTIVTNSNQTFQQYYLVPIFPPEPCDC